MPLLNSELINRPLRPKFWKHTHIHLFVRITEIALSCKQPCKQYIKRLNVLQKITAMHQIRLETQINRHTYSWCLSLHLWSGSHSFLGLRHGARPYSSIPTADTLFRMRLFGEFVKPQTSRSLLNNSTQLCNPVEAFHRSVLFPLSRDAKYRI